MNARMRLYFLILCSVVCFAPVLPASQDDGVPRSRAGRGGRDSSRGEFSGRSRAQFDRFDVDRDGVLSPEEQKLFR